MRLFILPVAFLLAVAAQAGVAQAQQGQGDTSASQPSSARQPSSAQPKPQSATATAPAGQKANPRLRVLLTNDNLNDATVKNAIQSAGSDAKSDSKTGQKQNPPAPAQQPDQQGAPPTTVAKPKLQLPSHQVLTDENLPALLGKEGINVVGTAAGLNGIFDCDTNCYDQVRQGANVYPGRDLAWMRDLHDGIDKLQDDGKWRAFLVHLVDIKSRYCKLVTERDSALSRVDNENNVTNEQINIRQEFNRKYDALTQESSAAQNEIAPLQAGYSVLVRSFMRVQESRIGQMSCTNPERDRGESDPDDPDEQ